MGKLIEVDHRIFSLVLKPCDIFTRIFLRYCIPRSIENNFKGNAHITGKETIIEEGKLKNVYKILLSRLVFVLRVRTDNLKHRVNRENSFTRIFFASLTIQNEWTLLEL